MGIVEADATYRAALLSSAGLLADSFAACSAAAACGESGNRAYTEALALRMKADRYRPDVSVFRDGKLLAVVECKTNLGRSRQQWKDDFSQRELELGSLPSAPSVFLLVLTAQNWHGFGTDARNGVQLFTLLRRWPSDVPLGVSPLGEVIHPIEPLFRTIAAL